MVLMISSNTFKVFSRAAAQTSGTTLEASTNPYRYIASKITASFFLLILREHSVLFI